MRVNKAIIRLFPGATLLRRERHLCIKYKETTYHFIIVSFSVEYHYHCIGVLFHHFISVLLCHSIIFYYSTTASFSYYISMYSITVIILP